MVAQAQPLLAEEQIGDVTVVKFGRAEILDERIVRWLARRLLNLIDHSPQRRFVLDLGNVGKLSTSMLGTFLTMHKRLHAEGGRLILCGVDHNLRAIFTIFKLPQLLAICKDEQEALQAF
jgi:anti-anti-sigma factor